MKILSIVIFSILLIIISCKSIDSKNVSSNKELTLADKILAKTVEAHGGKRYDNAHYEFIFRKNKFTFQQNKNGYRYSKTSQKDGKTIVDVLNNNDFTRTIDGEKVTLSEKEMNRYSSPVNSVVYFATLPYKLQDASVNKSYKGTTTIKGKEYEVLQITFDEENGGQDHDDVYHYWINKENYRIDYLAYNFQVNKGGVRFRSAYNTRIVDGILFQDYVNYKAPVGTPLSELPILLEKNELKKLSLIETENVVNLKN